MPHQDRALVRGSRGEIDGEGKLALCRGSEEAHNICREGRAGDRRCPGCRGGHCRSATRCGLWDCVNEGPFGRVHELLDQLTPHPRREVRANLRQDSHSGLNVIRVAVAEGIEQPRDLGGGGGAGRGEGGQDVGRSPQPDECPPSCFQPACL